MPYQLQIGYHNVYKLLAQVLANLKYHKKKIRSLSTFSLALSKVVNLDFFKDMHIHIYLEDFQETITSLTVKINPLVKFGFLFLNVQLALLFPSSTTRYLI